MFFTCYDCGVYFEAETFWGKIRRKYHDWNGHRVIVGDRPGSTYGPEHPAAQILIQAEAEGNIRRFWDPRLPAGKIEYVPANVSPINGYEEEPSSVVPDLLDALGDVVQAVEVASIIDDRSQDPDQGGSNEVESSSEADSLSGSDSYDSGSSDSSSSD